MTAREKISRLEELLARVQQRAAEPRAASSVSVASHVSPKATTGAMPATPMPPTPTPESSYAHHDDGSDGDVDVEVSTELVDIDVDVDIDENGMPLESGAQPVADHSGLPDETALAESMRQAMGIDTKADDDIPVLEPAEEEPAAKTPANEIEEPAPSSSPRPIASEKPEAFEEESAPRHTPPPESGKQVAAAPSTPPARKTSAPPPSLEGHTLIGGWREPGLGGPIIGQPGATGPHGVRVPAPGAANPAGAQYPTGHGPGSPLGSMPPEPITATRSSVPPRVSDRPLTPEVTKADLPGPTAGAKVASFEGAMPAFKPSTFGDLLDATLAL